MHIATIVPGQETSDGAGVRLTRMIGTRALDMVDPFLMLDRFDNEDPDAYIGGFPDHPHRGFETVTLMLDGRLRHRDSTGGEGVIGPGDVQWMTAGRGIVHSEMPEQNEGRMRGFQLWVNLPAAEKMTPAAYQDITADTIPEAAGDGYTARIIAGTMEGATGPAHARTPIGLALYSLAPNAAVRLAAAAGHNAFLCVHEGALAAPGRDGGEARADAPCLAVAGGDGAEPLTVTAGPEGAAFLYGHGQPIAEPVARYGPFVMNTQDEIVQAVRDFQAGRLG